MDNSSRKNNYPPHRIPRIRQLLFHQQNSWQFCIQAVVVSGRVAAFVRMENNLPDQLLNLFLFRIFAEAHCSQKFVQEFHLSVQCIMRCFLRSFLLADFFHASHIRLKNFRNLHGSVRLKIIFQKRNQHPGPAPLPCCSAYGRNIFHFRRSLPDLEPSRLCITQIGAAPDFEILLLSRRPGLYIHGLHFQIRQITGTTFQSSHRNIHRSK